MDQKQELRKRMKEKRDRISPQERRQKSAKICETDPAEGGVQPFRKREVIDDCTGSTLHLGRREQIGEMISSYFFM